MATEQSEKERATRHHGTTVELALFLGFAPDLQGGETKKGLSQLWVDGSLKFV